jgi:curved DNA-binding protein CbpA
VKDYYSILGIPRSASEDEIKEAYRRMAKRWHPDANIGSESAQRIMQDLNRAKEVLFEEDTRNEYIHLLNLQDTLSQDNLERLRKKWGDTNFAEPRTPPTTSMYPVPKFSRGKFYGVLIIIVGLISIAFIMAIQPDRSAASKDPIQEIIERNKPTTTLLPPRESEPDTIKVPDAAPDRLAQMAAILSLLQEHKAAAKYWEKALELDPTNTDVMTNLLFHYLKSKKYEQAFGLIETRVTSDTLKVIIYNRIGEFFLVEGKRFDAASAFEKAVQLGSPLNLTQTKAAEDFGNAKMRLEFFRR